MAAKKKKTRTQRRAPGPEEKRYVWRSASRFTRLDAQEVGEEIERVRSTYGVHVTASQIVDAATDPSSPLHEAFPWDDAEAAHEHRLDVARLLMRSYRSVRVVIVGGEPKEIHMPANVATPAERPGTQHYTTTEYAMNDPELRAHVLKQALSELAAFRRKYAELSELAIVFAAIDTTRKKVS